MMPGLRWIGLLRLRPGLAGALLIMAGLPVMALEPTPIAWAESTPEQGALRLRFRLEGVEDTWDLPTRARGETAQLILADTPVVQINLNVNRQKTTLHLMFPAAGAENGPWVRSELTGLRGLPQERSWDQIKFGGLDLARMKGDQSYEVLLAWDLRLRAVRLFLNGVEQGDVFPANKGGWEPAPREGLSAVAGGVLRSADGAVQVPVRVEAAELLAGAVSASEAARLSVGPPALCGEGRSEAGGPLELAGYRVTPLFSPNLAEVLIVREAELLDAQGRRRREPSEREWVLEGPGEVAATAQGLRLTTGGERVATSARGAVVLWAPYELPDGILVEYDFTPENSRRGLHILFWSAGTADAGSIFALDRQPRGGVFAEYLWKGLNSYHASIFATDDDAPRKVANLRKNDGFVLVACGDDRIAGHGPGAFRVRLLKAGPRSEVEVDGRTVLRYLDDGRANGDPLAGGRLGFRLMAHTGFAEIARLRVWKLTPR